MIPALILPFLLFFCAPASAAEEGRWIVPENNGIVQFRVRYDQNFLQGQLTDFSGDFTFSAAAPEAARGTLRFRHAAITTGQPPFDKDILSSDWLDTTHYPEGRLDIKGATHLVDDMYKIHGDMTLRNVTRPVTLLARLSQYQPESHFLFLEGTGTLQCRDFNLGQNSWAAREGIIDDTIVLAFSLSATLMP